jgi:DNA-binding NtrC family response regulator
MPGRGGLDLLGELVRIEPELPVLVLTAHGSVSSAVDAMQSGAFHYLLKPVDPDELVIVLRRALRESGLRRELQYLRSPSDGAVDERNPLGESDAWKGVMELAAVAAPSDAPILLCGESGTGKEEVAQYIHRRSKRASSAFVSVNCAAIPLELFESEFFGHRRGSFTGAVDDRVGRVKVAHNGTLFLDEINSLPEPAQAKVLRVLEDGVFQRLGESSSTAVDIRLISASNTDLRKEIEARRFRPDLFYRINVMMIELPPLRERPEDVELLANAFLAEFRAKLGRDLSGFDPAVLDALRRYAWPGNVRELRNVIERGVLLERGDRLSSASLPSELRNAPRHETRSSPRDLRSALLAEEKRLIEDALHASNGVRREAARVLGVDERNLAYYLKKHGLHTARSDSPESA